MTGRFFEVVKRTGKAWGLRGRPQGGNPDSQGKMLWIGTECIHYSEDIQCLKYNLCLSYQMIGSE